MPCAMLDVMNVLVFVVCYIVVLVDQSMIGYNLMCSQVLGLCMMLFW